MIFGPAQEGQPGPDLSFLASGADTLDDVRRNRLVDLAAQNSTIVVHFCMYPRERAHSLLGPV